MRNRKWIFVLLTLVFIISICGCNKKKVNSNIEETGSVVMPNTNVSSDKKQELNLYYYNHSDYDYIKQVTDKLKVQLPNVTINVYYLAKGDYVENLVKKNSDSTIADLFLISESELERAYLAGITTTNHFENFDDRTQYSIGAVNACTYKGELRAYPLFFDTQVLLCNENFGMLLPDSFEELKEMTTSFEIKEGMILEHILNWDISDMTLNYAFVGKYLNACGLVGDDRSSVSIDNADVIKCVTYLKDLAAFFNINRDNVSRDKVIESFAAGRTAFAIVNSKDLKSVDESVKNLGENAFDYKVCPVPNIDNDTFTSGVSETVMMVVNPFSENKDMASFVAMVFSSYSEECVYETIGKFPAKIKNNIDGRDYSAVYTMYDKSHPHIKLIDAGDFYTRLDIAFHNVCDGADITETFKGLQEYLSQNLK